jgi:hypothetical protein
MNPNLAIRPAREAFRLWSVAVCGVLACMIVACGGSSDQRLLEQAPPERVFAYEPQIAFTRDGNGVIAYREQTEREHGYSRRDRLRTISFGSSTNPVGATTFFDIGQVPPSIDGERLPEGSLSLAADASEAVVLIHPTGFPDLSDRTGFRGCGSTTSSPQWACSYVANTLDERESAIATNGAGSALALIALGDARPQRILKSIYRTADGNWSSPQEIGDSLGDHDNLEDDASVTFSASGIGFALFTGRNESLVARRYISALDQWETPLTLAPAVSTNTQVSNPRLVLHRDAPDASAVALWIEGPGLPGIRATRSVNNGTGWRATPPVPGSECANRMDAAMAADGQVLVVWSCITGPNESRLFASRYINGAWSPSPQEIGTADHPWTRVRVAVDALGNGVVIWRGVTELFSASLLAGGGYDPPRSLGAISELGTIRERDDYPYDVAMDDQGRARAVWVRNVGATRSEGTRIAQQEVGPFALTLTAQRHTFGGEAIPITIRLGSARTEAVTVNLFTVIGGITAPKGTILFYPGQTEAPFTVATTPVTDFVEGRLEVSYEGFRWGQPITLMPEPAAVALTVTPPTVLGGEAATISLQVTPIYPVALNLQLESNNAVAPVPAQVTTSMTSSAAAVPVTTTTTTTAQTAVFTARFRNRSGTGSLLVNPTSFGQSVLTVSVFSPGTGTVTSTPAGITNCNQTCTASYPIGTPVTLTPTPTLGYRFFAWDGDPDCSEGKLTMLTARTCRAIFLVADPPYPDGTGWTQIALPLLGLNYVNPSPALALEGVIPIVAHLTKSTATAVPQVFVQRLQGNGVFLQMGFDSLNIDKLKDASEPAIVTTTHGLPYVAWIEGTGAQQNLYVSRLTLGNALEWVSVGPLNTPLNYVAGSRASSPSIALDAELNPMVAWIEDGAVKFKRFNGTAWVQAQGGEGPASAGADRVRLSSYSAFVGVADPVIAWTQGSGAQRLLKAARDFAFTPLGTGVNATTLNLTEFGVLAEASGAIVSWADSLIFNGQTNTTVHSQRWNGTAWVNVAGQVFSNNPHPFVSLAMPRNEPTVAWNYRFVPNDTSHFGVSSLRNGLWSVITAQLILPGDANIGPTPIELANRDSPIVVRVERNSLNEYIWWTLRYYQP